MTRRLLIPLACLLAGMASCGRSNREVQLSALCFPPTPDAGGLCAFSSEKCDEVLASGHLFVDLVSSNDTLRYPIQIDNQRLDNSDTESGRTNTNTAFVDRFDMKYETPGFKLPSSSVNQVATVHTSGSTVAVVNLISSSEGAALRQVLPAGPTEVVIKVKAHGRYGDDTEFETAEFSVPVAISQGVIAPYTCSLAGQTLVGVCPQQGQTAVILCQ